MLVILKREVDACFRSLYGWLITAFFLLMNGVYFVMLNLLGGYAEYGYTLGSTRIILLILVPIVTMKSFGEEKRQKTEVLYFTAPIKLFRVALSKFLGALAVLVLPLAVMATCPLALTIVGKTAVLQSYLCMLAYVFMLAALVAIGVFVSAVVDSLSGSALITFAILLLNYLLPSVANLLSQSGQGTFIGLSAVALLAGAVTAAFKKRWKTPLLCYAFFQLACLALYFAKPEAFTGALPAFLQKLAIFARYDHFIDGLFIGADMVFFGSVIALFLYFSAGALEKRRWSE